MKRMRFAVPDGFAFGATVESHGWYLLAPFRWDRSARTLHRPESFAGARPVDLSIRCSDALEVSIDGGAPDRALLEPRLRRMFQLDLDLAEFHRLCAESTSHGKVAGERFGRLLCGSTFFEDVVKIIATTNTTWRQTCRMVKLLVERCGVPAPSGQKTFPAPAEILAVSPEALQRDCRLGYRARYVHAAAAMLQGIVGQETAAADGPALHKRFLQIPGIGPYGAAHLLAMEGRHDHIAVDTEFRRFVRERYHGGRAVRDATLLRRYARWGRWKYLAYWSEVWDAVRVAVDAENEPQ
ncbi:MAG TPA: endonuclease III domain-containing protein [Thermoanaerobaculia bacterium]|nr:endonuclease III domain-containing protein [Thermoanaerobaculia bacterium]